MLTIEDVLPIADRRMATESDLWAVKETLRRIADNPYPPALRSERQMLIQIVQYARELELQSRPS